MCLQGVELGGGMERRSRTAQTGESDAASRAAQRACDRALGEWSARMLPKASRQRTGAAREEKAPASVPVSCWIARRGARSRAAAGARPTGSVEYETNDTLSFPGRPFNDAEGRETGP